MKGQKAETYSPLLLESGGPKRRERRLRVTVFSSIAEHKFGLSWNKLLLEMFSSFIQT